MVLVPLLIVPVLTVAAALAERRLGPSTAGWITALPVGFALAAVAVVRDAGGVAASAMALSAAAHVIGQVVLAVVVAAVLPRCGLLVATLAGTVAYLVCALGVGLVPDLLAVAVAVPALLIAPH
ncbi:MAG: hypothetical protein JOY78_06450, partial [Pseudonocardia sp.]|nr:hypothetical protein [Pseudonocardia sp.]